MSPVVADQVHVEVVRGHLGLPGLELLHGTLAHEERCSSCTMKPLLQL